MIETGLVYVHSTKPTRRFVGCGALIEGGYVATCRHVWGIATEAGVKAHPEWKPEVEIEFPGSWQDGTTIRHVASFVDLCERVDGRSPDFVLLLPKGIPGNVITLQLATEDRFEVGEGYTRAGLQGLNQDEPHEVRDVEIEGEIRASKGFDGRRQFTGKNLVSYWSKPGASGSPVFRKGGQQLAGILSLSELGGRHEAFMVPATTIRRYLLEHLLKRTPAAEGINPDLLRPILEAIGATDVPVAEIPNRLKQFVDAARARAGEPVASSTDGADIDATIGAARTKLGDLDAAAARMILGDKIAQEERARRQRVIPLLEEQAAIERLSYDYDAAKTTLQKLLEIDPERIRNWLRLGDLFVTTGALEQGVNRFWRGLTIAERLATADPGNVKRRGDLAVAHERIGGVRHAQGNLTTALTSYQAALAIREHLVTADHGNAERRRDLAVAHDKIGDVQQAQGDLPAALTSYQASLAIVESLATADPGNATWRRDLAVAHNKIGGVRQAQGDMVAALASYQASLAIRERLAKADPGNTVWQRDLGISHEKMGDVQRAQGDLTAALTSYQASLTIAERLTKADPGNAEWRRDLAVSHERIGDVQNMRGKAIQAIAAFEQALRIYRELQARNPDDIPSRVFSVIPLWRLGRLRGGEGRADFEAALAILKPLADADRLDANRRRWIEQIQSEVNGLTE
jgi:tetratricopeptide (TPR) repeat protein